MRAEMRPKYYLYLVAYRPPLACSVSGYRPLKLSTSYPQN